MNGVPIVGFPRPLHHALGQLGHAVPDAEWRAGEMGAGTRLAVAAFQRKAGLDASGEPDALTAAAIDAAVAALARPTMIVCGYVRRADGTAVAGAAVRAFDRDLRSEQTLGEATADATGWYEIAYTADLFGRAEKDAADLVVRVFAALPIPVPVPAPVKPPGRRRAVAAAKKIPGPIPPRAVTPIATSDIHFNAATVEAIDLVVGGSELRGPSEFERVAAEIEPLREGIAAADFTDADAAFLTGETGLAAEWIAAFIAAHRLAREAPASAVAVLMPGAFYGLVRRNLPATLGALVAAGAAAHRAALEGALSDNIVPASLTDSLEAVIATLRAAAIGQSSAPNARGRPPASDLIGLAVTPAVRDQFIAFHYDYADTASDFWDALAADATLGPAAPALRQVAELAALTDQHAPLMKLLHTTVGPPTSDGLRKLARNSPADWEAILATPVDGAPIGVPPDTPGATDAERTHNYAQALYQTVADLYPTAVVAARLSQSAQAADKAIAQWLDARPDFDLATSSIDSALTPPGRPGTRGEVPDPNLVDGLKRLQRVHRITPDAEAQQALLTDGLDSAQRISQISRTAFIERYAGRVGGADRAAAIHANAEQNAARATTLFAALSTTLNPISLPMLPNPAAIYASIPRPAGGPALPDFTTLFGAPSLCDCAHCRSVYSPAAYLVDVLHFLDRHGAFARFNSRRPDIGLLRLDCVNTNTPLPYIDLVNEVLERAVAPPTTVTWPQTTWTADELRLSPEYVLLDAYNALAQATYPWNLPFDLGLVTSRAYLSLLGLSRDTLMATFRGPTAPSEAEIAAEALGLSAAEVQILTTTSTAAELAYWGTPAVNIPADLQNVATLLERSGLTYAELETLLTAFFINPTGAVKVQFADSNCDLTRATIPALTADTLQRIHRFTRLQRALGWPAPDLDKVLRGISAGLTGIAPTTLARLAEAKRLHARLGDPLVEMASWWDAIDTWGDDGRGTSSLYDRVFLNRTIADPPYAPFQLDPADRRKLRPLPPDARIQNPTITPLHAAAVADALAISHEDLVRLTADQVPNLVTFDNLSALYRIVSLCRALGLSVEDFRSLKLLTGVDPFAAGKPENVAKFVANAEKVRASGFSVAELAYLLGHAPAPITPPTEEALAATLDGLRTALSEASRRAEGVEPIPADELAATLRTWLGTALAPEFVDAAFDLITIAPTESDPMLPTDALFVDTHFAAFLDKDVAKAKLLGISASAPPNILTAPDERMRYVLDGLGRFTYAQVVAAIVTQRLADALSLNPAQVADLLDKVASANMPTAPARTDLIDPIFYLSPRPLLNDGTANAQFTAQFASLRRFHAVAATWHAKRDVLAARLRLSADDLAAIGSAGAPWLTVRLLPPPPKGQKLLDDAALNKLIPQPFERWESLADLASLRDGRPTNGPSIFEIAGLATSQPLLPSDDMIREALCNFTGWDPAAVGVVASILGLTVPADYADGRALMRIQAALDSLAQLGVSSDRVAAWVGTGVTPSAADDLKRAVRARFDAQRWAEVARPVQDRLREQKRDALVAYLVAREPAFRSAADLYDHYLIDPEMSPCMLTSRIVQASGAVQQFVQRALLNLEPDVVPPLSSDAAHEWEWMKRYRVWEANRKVFLYPENWLDPALRDDKTPFFKELEEALLQRDITEDTAEEALRQYLAKLDSVAHLQVVAMYREERPDGPSILHVFGRSAGIPHDHYYRRRIGDHVWTAWEKVDLDIQSDHLAPIVVNRSLRLFWLEFFSKTTASGLKYDEIGLAWSTYKNGRWSAKQVSGEDHRLRKSIARPGATGFDPTIPPKGLAFKAAFENKDLVLNCVMFGARGAFVLSNAVTDIVSKRPNCARDLAIQDIEPQLTNGLVPKETYPQANTFEEWHSGRSGAVQTDDLWLCRAVDRPNSVSVLAATPTYFFLLYPHQYPEFASREFFFHDRAAVFYVRPVRMILTGWALERAYAPENLLLTAGAPPAARTSEASRSLILEVANRASSDRAAGLREVTATSSVTELDNERHGYRFETFYHPYACEFLGLLNTAGIPGLFRRPVQQVPENLGVGADRFFTVDYKPGRLADPLYPREDIDFSLDGAYAQYNWEIFFHIPILIADRLSQNQHFEEAQKWFHYIFDPTDRSSDSAPARFWQFRPFFDEASGKLLQNLALVMAGGSRSPALIQARAELEVQIQAWRDDPFNPHHIARLRISAYARSVVMKYLDNLIAWGDQLFREDTIEAINEATQLYVLAAQMLGAAPARVAREDLAATQTFNAIRGNLDDFSNAVIGLENIVAPSTEQNTATLRTAFIAPLRPPPPRPPVLPVLYFCIPQNTQLLHYWTTVGDRLFKIRHCMTIDGTVRQLPLFAPPIDPGLLVRAKAAGLDISAILSDLAAPAPHYRFGIVHRTALELVADVKALGAELLSALEKRDAEMLSLLRSSHEVQLLKAVRQIKQRQIDEAKQTLEGLAKTREATTIRHDYYKNIAFMNPGEAAHLGLTAASLSLQAMAHQYELAGQFMRLIPEAQTTPPGTQFGGANLGGALGLFAGAFSAQASELSGEASMAATLGSYQRRADEWKLQEQLAAKELEQIDKQILAAQIRLAIAEYDLTTQEVQIESAESVDDFMRTKYTNAELYSWMVSRIATVYFQSYQLAYDVARRAQKAFQFELAEPGASYITFGYWDNLRQGLLAGHALHHDLRRMEAAYQERNGREYEITKHVSLALVNPMALVKLKIEGKCEVTLNEVLFDLDYPGHYLRRIKSVGLSIPCVVGPYTSVNCMLTLLSNKIRAKTDVSSGYAESATSPTNDDRFIYDFAAIQSIATSGAQNDSGLFELNFRDERYLPFEGVGAISQWRIELPKETNRFDRDTISDVVVHVRYTARDGGKALQTAAWPTANHGTRLFSLKHEFSQAWHELLTAASGAPQVVTIEVTPDRLPFHSGEQALIAPGVTVWPMYSTKPMPTDAPWTIVHTGGSDTVILEFENSHSLDLTDLKDLWLVIGYGYP